MLGGHIVYVKGGNIMFVGCMLGGQYHVGWMHVMGLYHVCWCGGGDYMMYVRGGGGHIIYVRLFISCMLGGRIMYVRGVI